MKLAPTSGLRGTIRRIIIRARIRFGLIQLTAGQAAIVRAFIRRVLDMHIPDPHRASVILVETGIVESGLRILANPNVPESESIPHDGEGTDHASVGPLQQQVPMWGTAADCMNPYTSAGKFLNDLTSFDWQSMPTGQAAQTVQVSAYPDRYQAQEPLATAIVNQLWAQPAPQPVPSEEDDVIYLFAATDPKTKAITKGWVIGPKGIQQCTADEIGAIAKITGRPIVEDQLGDAYMTRAEPKLGAVLGA